MAVGGHMSNGAWEPGAGSRPVELLAFELLAGEIVPLLRSA